MTSYGNAQVQGNARKCPEHMHMQDTSRMCVKRVWNAYEMRLEHSWDASVLVQNLKIKL